MKSTWKKTTLDLHDLCVDRACNLVTALLGIILGVIGLEVGKILNVLIEVASPGGRDDRVDDGRSTSLVLAKALI